MMSAGDGPAKAAKVTVAPPAPPPKYVDPCQAELDAAKEASKYGCASASEVAKADLFACRKREAQSITAREASDYVPSLLPTPPIATPTDTPPALPSPPIKLNKTTGRAELSNEPTPSAPSGETLRARHPEIFYGGHLKP